MLSAALLLVACSQPAATPILKHEGTLDSGPSFSAYLVSYMSAGLKIYAMVAVPNQEVPRNGFPVVIANHGYTPDPSKYGITAEGIDSRPGDYYRSVPELYASRGYLVVIPDYRGHNSSEGLEFVHKPDSVDRYADDVIALMSALDELEHADTSNVFIWSHSMGGAVSMRVLLATDIVKGSSFWGTVNVNDLESRFGELDGPVVIQHSYGDKSTDHSNATNFAEALRAINHPCTFYSYESDDHYFEGEIRETAADRDDDFFQSLMR